MRDHILSSPRHALRGIAAVAAAVSGLAVSGCHDEHTQAPAGPQAVAVTNRIDVPPAVVENLGITYASARRAKLERWLRVTGELEVAADRRHEVRAPAEGRFRLTVTRWQTVSAGDVLGRIESPSLRAAQQALATAQADLFASRLALEKVDAQQPTRRALAAARAKAAVAAGEHLTGLRALLGSARSLEGRCESRLDNVRELASNSSVAVKQLHDAERERYEAAETALNAAQAVAHGEVALRQAELDAAAAQIDAKSAVSERRAAARMELAATLAVQSNLEGLASLTGRSLTELQAGDDETPAWSRLTALELHAQSDGVVEELVAADGRWVDAGEVLCTVVDASELRFRGRCPEDDLERIPAGAEVRIAVAMNGRAPIVSHLIWPPRVADPVARTVLLEAVVPNTGDPLPRGLSATAAVLIGRSEMAEVLIPVAAVTRDGLESLVFRLNPENSQQVIRTPVTLGARNKQWVEVISGVSAKDQVVIDGVQQLKQTGAGRGKAGGHFHADGTFHEGADH